MAEAITAEQTVMVPANSPAYLLRQVGIMAGIAAAVAIGVYVVMWAREPSYVVLQQGLSPTDVTGAVSTLQGAQIPYKVVFDRGALLVPANKLAEAEMLLASDGMLGADDGWGLFDESPGMGTSSLQEQVRFQRALEGELSRTIASLRGIQAASVHLALPRRNSPFVRDQDPPKASVVVTRRSGYNLTREQVQSIIQTVAGGVDGLVGDNVAVIDDSGRPLSSMGDDSGMSALADRQRLVAAEEKKRINSIERIVGPIVGFDNLQATVYVDMDFTETVQTSKTHNPDQKAVVSEQEMLESRTGGIDGGVPGALSNQPPAAAAAPEEAVGGDGEATTAAPKSERSERVTNFAPDESITSTKFPTGGITRLMVSVAVNHKPGVDDEGNPTLVPREQEELDRIERMVKQAVGFDAARGDSVEIINEEFVRPELPEAAPEPPIWQQPWVLDLARQGLGGLFVLILTFGILRPTIKNLMRKAEPPEVSVTSAATPAELAGDPATPALPSATEADAAAAEQNSVAEQVKALAAPAENEVKLTAIKEIVRNEPRLAAQVVKTWVNES